MTLQSSRRRMFWVISRLSFALYRRFPVFGTLRASVGIIQQGEHYLVIRRNDGRGLSLPGGLAMTWESEEKTLKREIAEETGLEVTSLEPVLQYYFAAPIPCNVSVFQVSATGQVRGSWEGDPEWATISEMRSHIMASQRPVIEKILSSADDKNRQAAGRGGNAAAAPPVTH
jgi:8-oxo-dGTP pyrophosphatase MutT (NUDIX family)